MEQVDLFETLVRYLAIKPLKFEKFDLEQAKSIIKKEREGAITFIGEHGYFEDVVDASAKTIIKSGTENGTVYLFIRGDSCTERMKRNLIELLMNVRKIVVFGDPEKWVINDPKIQFVKPGEIFSDNHQRFFIYQSSGLNIALVSRHQEREGKTVIEAAMTSASDAVDLIGQTVGTKIYQNMN